MKQLAIILVMTLLFMACDQESSLPGDQVGIQYDAQTNMYHLDLDGTNGYDSSHRYHLVEDLRWKAVIEPSVRSIPRYRMYRTKLVNRDLDATYGLIINGVEALQPNYSHIEAVAYEVSDDNSHMIPSVIKACKDNDCEFFLRGEKLPGIYKSTHEISEIEFGGVRDTCTIKGYIVKHIQFGGVGAVYKAILDLGNQFEVVDSATTEKGNTIVVYKNDTSYVYACDGKLLATFEYTNVEPTYMPSIYLVNDDTGLVKVVNRQGEILLPTGSYNIMSSETVVCFNTDNSLGILLGDQAPRLFEQDTANPIQFLKILRKDRYLVRQNFKEGIMDSEGKFILEPTYDYHTTIKDSRITFGKDESAGVFSIDDGKLLQLTEPWPSTW